MYNVVSFIGYFEADVYFVLFCYEKGFLPKTQIHNNICWLTLLTIFIIIYIFIERYVIK